MSHDYEAPQIVEIEVVCDDVVASSSATNDGTSGWLPWV